MGYNAPSLAREQKQKARVQLGVFAESPAGLR